MPSKNEGAKNQIDESKQSDKPQLLPVSCSYFFNIVRTLLLKSRKNVLKYILIDTEGKIFDKLVENIQHHSLSNLLIELMQI